jgi:FKBP-type peptidyl-prolyl cis-trans isomerase
MKVSKFFAGASMALMMVACGTNAQQGSVSYTDQNGKTEKFTVTTDAAVPSNGEVDSVSYLFGCYVGSMAKGSDFGDLNFAKIKKGMQDFLKAQGEFGDSTFAAQFDMDPNLLNEVIMGYMNKRQELKAAVNHAKTAKYFECVKADVEGTDTTANGVLYKIFEAGNDVKAETAQDSLWVSYVGTKLDGTEFDKNDSTLFFTGRVVPGFAEGLKLVGEGGHIKLWIPGQQAYGMGGSRMGFEPDEALIFDVTVEKIAKFVPKEDKDSKKGRK